MTSSDLKYSITASPEARGRFEVTYPDYPGLWMTISDLQEILKELQRRASDMARRR